MSFHIIDGDAPGLGSHRAVRTPCARFCAWMVIAPAMLGRIVQGIYVLATDDLSDHRIQQSHR